MTDHDARTFANQVIGLLLTHQPEVLGRLPLATEESAKQAAKNIAVFRQALLKELESHR